MCIVTLEVDQNWSASRKSNYDYRCNRCYNIRAKEPNEAWREKNREKARLASKKWREENPEKHRANNAARKLKRNQP